MHIDAYCIKLLENRAFLTDEYKKFYDNCYILQNVKGAINSEVLSNVIKRALWNRKVQSLLTGILWYVNKDSITDDVFRMLLRFPYRIRHTYLDAIAHSNLAFYQYQMIYKADSCWEAFAYLFYKICEYDFFQEQDMLQLLRDNGDITSDGIQGCIDWALKEGCSNSKLEAAQAWVNSMKRSTMAGSK